MGVAMLLVLFALFFRSVVSSIATSSSNSKNCRSFGESVAVSESQHMHGVKNLRLFYGVPRRVGKTYIDRAGLVAEQPRDHLKREESLGVSC